MRQCLLAASLGVMVIAQTVHADVITLIDGTRIHAEVLSLHNGVYTVRSDTLGTVELARSKIVTIDQKNAKPNETDHTYEALKADVMANPAAMNSIMALQNDPEVRALLSNPETLKAIQSLDLNALSNNPQILQFMQRPEVREINELMR